MNTKKHTTSLGLNRVKKRQGGFSLVEIAVVMLIVGLLVAGSASLVKNKRDNAKYAETEEILKQIKEALLTYTLINGHMPCPDTSPIYPSVTVNFGRENRGMMVSNCATASGRVPFRDLGLMEENIRDSWGNFIAYNINTSAINFLSVLTSSHSAAYFNQGSSPGLGMGFGLATNPRAGVPGVGNLNIIDGTKPPFPVTYKIENATAVLVAYNSNGLSTLENCMLNAQPKERENCNGDAIFHYHRIVLELDGHGGSVPFYDDQLLAISASEIKNKFLTNNPSWIN